MAAKKFTPGAFVRIPLTDGSYGYGRLREFPYASFYDLRTETPIDDLDMIASKPVLFSLSVHKSVLDEWEVIGNQPLEDALRQPLVRFKQSITDPSNCMIFDTEGNQRRATQEECVGLERAANWEPNHVQDRLLDHFMQRPNKWMESLKVRT